MALLGRKDRRKPSAPLGTTGPAGYRTQRSIGSAAKSCPYRPVGREAGANLRLAFRSAAEGSGFGFALREMSLWSPDGNLETAATDFKESE
jgi:hypothetical protein